MKTLKRYIARRKLMKIVRTSLVEIDRADAIYGLVKLTLEQVEDYHPITFGQFQLVTANMMATVSRLCSNRREALTVFKKMEKLARMVASYEKDREAS